jgi:NitT/TauT family transport system substrate-binding protein
MLPRTSTKGGYAVNESRRDLGLTSYVIAREAGRKFTRREIVKLGIATWAAGSLGTWSSTAAALTKMPVAQSGVTLFYLYVYVGIEEGFFREEGLDIDLFTAGGGGGQPAVNALAAREAMCSTQDPVLCEAARQKGATVRSIGALVNRMAVYVVGKKDIASGDLSAWKGRTLAILQRPNTAASVINYVLSKQGWKEDPKNNWFAPDGGKPLTTIEVRQGNEFPPLLSGAVDMTAGYEPGASDALTRGKDLHIVWSFPEYFGEFLFSSLCANDEDIKQRPQMLQGFVNGIARSLKFVRTDNKRTLEIARKWFPQLSPVAIESAFNTFIRENVYPQRTVISEKAWQANFDNFLPFVKYPLKLPVNMKEVTNMEFAANADKKFGLA